MLVNLREVEIEWGDCDAAGIVFQRVVYIRRSSFDVEHRVLKDGKLAIEDRETRVWKARDPEDASRIKAIAIPDEVVAALS